MYSLNVFLLFSIAGHIFEELIYLIFNMHSHSGFLYLFWTPLYGIGALLSGFLYKILNNKIKNKITLNIILVLTFFLSLTILEELGGILLEQTMGYSLWNYEGTPLSIGKYVSILASIIWTIMAILYIYLIKKHTDKIINKIPKGITIILSLLFISDLLLTMIKIIRTHIM